MGPFNLETELNRALLKLLFSILKHFHLQINLASATYRVEKIVV